MINLLKESLELLQVDRPIIADYPAEAVKNMSDKDFDSLVSKCLFQEFRIKTVSKL
jgi:hypothetical protein